MIDPSRSPACCQGSADGDSAGADADGSGSGSSSIDLVICLDAGYDCRICFDASSPESMVAPCACKGSLQHVHTSCLMRWALERAALGAARGCLVCEVCHTDFALPAARKEELQQALSAGEKAK
jgi:hypothetical protein